MIWYLLTKHRVSAISSLEWCRFIPTIAFLSVEYADVSTLALLSPCEDQQKRNLLSHPEERLAYDIKMSTNDEEEHAKRLHLQITFRRRDVSLVWRMKSGIWFTDDITSDKDSAACRRIHAKGYYIIQSTQVYSIIQIIKAKLD